MPKIPPNPSAKTNRRKPHFLGGQRHGISASKCKIGSAYRKADTKYLRMSACRCEWNLANRRLEPGYLRMTACKCKLDSACRKVERGHPGMTACKCELDAACRKGEPNYKKKYETCCIIKHISPEKNRGIIAPIFHSVEVKSEGSNLTDSEKDLDENMSNQEVSYTSTGNTNAMTTGPFHNTEHNHKTNIDDASFYRKPNKNDQNSIGIYEKGHVFNSFTYDQQLKEAFKNSIESDQIESAVRNSIATYKAAETNTYRQENETEKFLNQYNLDIVRTIRDGDCFYDGVAKLKLKDIPSTVQELRTACYNEGQKCLSGVGKFSVDESLNSIYQEQIDEIIKEKNFAEEIDIRLMACVLGKHIIVYQPESTFLACTDENGLPYEPGQSLENLMNSGADKLLFVLDRKHYIASKKCPE